MEKKKRLWVREITIFLAICQFCFAATRCHTLGGQLGAWGGVKGAGAGLRGAEGGSGAPSEVDALVRRGNMTVLVNVASHLLTRAYGF